MPEEVLAFGRCKAIQELADPVPEAFDRALFVFSQVGLELREGLLDRIQVRGIRWQVAKLRACGFDCAANVFAFVSAEIVHHNNVARLEGWDKDLGDIGLETLAVHRAIEDHWRGKATGSKSSCEGGDLPMAVRGRAPQTPAAQRPASEPYHIGGTSCFIDEDQPLRIEAGLAFAPAPAGGSHVRALLFAGQYRFFYS